MPPSSVLRTIYPLKAKIVSNKLVCNNKRFFSSTYFSTISAAFSLILKHGSTIDAKMFINSLPRIFK